MDTQGEFRHEPRVADIVEEGADIGVGDIPKAFVAQLADAGNRAVDAAAGTIGEGGFEELFFEGARKLLRDSGLDHTVAHGRDEEFAGEG